MTWTSRTSTVDGNGASTPRGTVPSQGIEDRHAGGWQMAERCFHSLWGREFPTKNSMLSPLTTRLGIRQLGSRPGEHAVRAAQARRLRWGFLRNMKWMEHLMRGYWEEVRATGGDLGSKLVMKNPTEPLLNTRGTKCYMGIMEKQ